MATEWYYQLDGKDVGPIPPSTLRQLANDGVLSPESPVRRGCDANWTVAKHVRGLFPETAQTPVLVKSGEHAAGEQLDETEIVSWLDADNGGSQTESTPIREDFGRSRRAVPGGEATKEPHRESKELRRESGSMVAVDCENCGATLPILTAATGGQVRCPRCGNAVSTKPPSRTPVILAFSALGAIVLVFAGIVIYECCLRDTWARDNRSVIIERLDEAQELVDSRKDDRALEKYGELMGLIGDHAIDDADLKDRLAYAKEQQKRIVAEREATQRKLAEEQARREEVARQAANRITPPPAYRSASQYDDPRDRRWKGSQKMEPKKRLDQIKQEMDQIDLHLSPENEKIYNDLKRMSELENERIELEIERYRKEMKALE